MQIHIQFSSCSICHAAHALRFWISINIIIIVVIITRASYWMNDGHILLRPKSRHEIGIISAAAVEDVVKATDRPAIVLVALDIII